MVDATRFSVHEDKNGNIYLLDRVTGQMWIVALDVQGRRPPHFLLIRPDPTSTKS